MEAVEANGLEIAYGALADTYAGCKGSLPEEEARVFGRAHSRRSV